MEITRRRNLLIPPEEESDTKRREAELAHAVMSYLAEHPQAMDSAQGIAEWWVMREQLQVDVQALVRVLQRLVDEGLIEKVGSPNGPLYRLNR
jgi:DNA-binding MarR family transcriptional regulator